MVCVLPNMNLCVCDFAICDIVIKIVFEQELKIEKLAVSGVFKNLENFWSP